MNLRKKKLKSMTKEEEDKFIKDMEDRGVFDRIASEVNIDQIAEEVVQERKANIRTLKRTGIYLLVIGIFVLIGGLVSLNAGVGIYLLIAGILLICGGVFVIFTLRKS